MSEVTKKIPLRSLVYSRPQLKRDHGFTDWTIDSAIESGQLEAVMLGKRQFITKASVDLLIDEAMYGRHRTAATPTDPAEALRALAAESATST
jgi:hypothetical protein